MDGWRYYNHAMVPTCAPHEEADTSVIESGEIWQHERKPLLARWTSNFDCGYETNWWYIIKETPFDILEISPKERKSIRQALKKCYVKKIDPAEYSLELYNVYSAAFEKYENADNRADKNSFIISCKESSSITYWGGFDIETDTLIGYVTTCDYLEYVEIQTAKFDLTWSKNRVSDALYYSVFCYYLNDCGRKYVCSGHRNINHKTNTQEYKIKRFGCRKAYCNLNVKYRPGINALVKIIFPIRKLFLKLDKITVVHQLNGVLKMEEVVRNDRK